MVIQFTLKEDAPTKSKTIKQNTENRKVTPRDLSDDDFVAVEYDKDWFVGKVMSKDNDGEFRISFLRPTKTLTGRRELFKWPEQPDILDIGIDHIICKVAAPSPVGKSGRSIRLCNDDVQKIEECFSSLISHENLKC